MLVYLVDDEEVIRRSLGVMLKLAGYECAFFGSGSDLLDWVEGLAPGCILLDMRMPDMDGLEVQHHLNGRGVTMPVVFMTGHGDLAVAAAALHGGACDFLEKPFDRATLLAGLERARLKLTDPAGYRAARDAAARAVAALSERERSVLAAFGRGQSNRVAAESLSLGVAAIEAMRTALIEKLGGRTLSDAVRIAHLGGAT